MFDLSGITVEPVVLFHGPALHIYNLAQTFAIYQAVCHQKFRSSNMSEDCSNLEDVVVQNRIQEETARWGIYITLTLFFPVLISELVLGEKIFLYN